MSFSDLFRILDFGKGEFFHFFQKFLFLEIGVGHVLQPGVIGFEIGLKIDIFFGVGFRKAILTKGIISETRISKSSVISLVNVLPVSSLSGLIIIGLPIVHLFVLALFIQPS